jgi:cell division transport system permease protein
MMGTRVRRAAAPLPVGRFAGVALLPWLFALHVYIIGIAAAGLLLVHDAVQGTREALTSRLTVQVPAEASNARIQTMLAAIRQTAGVQSARLLTLEETARLLEPWLGTPLPVDELPIPRLIDVQPAAAATIDLAKLREQLASIDPEMRLDDHRGPVAALDAAALKLQIGLGAALAIATVLAVVLSIYATRNALLTGRSVTELLSLLGAPDRAIARPFVERLAVAALLGGGIAVVAGLVTSLSFAGLAPLLRLPGTGPADWRLWAILIGAALATAVIAGASALVTVQQRLARLP